MNPPPTSWTQLTPPTPWSPTTPGEVLTGRLLKPETRTRHADSKVFTSWSVRLADGSARFINHVQLVAILESEGLQPGTWVRAVYTGQRLGNQGRTYGTFNLYVAADSPALTPPTFGDEDAPLPVPPPPGRDVPWELLAPEAGLGMDRPEDHCDGPPELAPIAVQPVRAPGARLPPPRELRSLKRYLAEVESMTDGALAPQVWLDHGPHGATDAVQRKARDYLVDVLRVRFRRPQGRDELTHGLIQERSLRRARGIPIPTDPQPHPALAEVREDDRLPSAVAALGVSARYASDAHELVELWRREAPEADLGHRAAAWSWLVHVLEVRFGMRVGAGRYLAAWVGDHTAKLPRPAPAPLPVREAAPPEPETPTLLQAVSPVFVAAVDALTSPEEVAAVWLLHGDPLKPRGAVVSTIAWDYMLAALPALGVSGDKAARDRWLRDRTALARRQRAEVQALGDRGPEESDAPSLAEEGD